MKPRTSKYFRQDNGISRIPEERINPVHPVILSKRTMAVAVVFTPQQRQSPTRSEQTLTLQAALDYGAENNPQPQGGG
jgi:hypothetical protein